MHQKFKATPKKKYRNRSRSKMQKFFCITLHSIDNKTHIKTKPTLIRKHPYPIIIFIEKHTTCYKLASLLLCRFSKSCCFFCFPLNGVFRLPCGILACEFYSLQDYLDCTSPREHHRLNIAANSKSNMSHFLFALGINFNFIL